MPAVEESWRHGLMQAAPMILAKLKAWALGLLAILGAIGAAVLYGRSRGKKTQQQADEAKQAQANIQAAQQRADAQETRNEVEAKVQELPAAPPQIVATADPATAAGKLRDDGWVRD